MPVKTSAEFDYQTQSDLRKQQMQAALEEEYSSYSIEQLVDARYEIAQAASEAEIRKSYLNTLISDYLVNLGTLKAEIANTYRVSVRTQSRETLDANLLFAAGVESSIIESCKKRSEFTVVDVRRI